MPINDYLRIDLIQREEIKRKVKLFRRKITFNDNILICTQYTFIIPYHLFKYNFIKWWNSVQVPLGAIIEMRQYLFSSISMA